MQKSSTVTTLALATSLLALGAARSSLAASYSVDRTVGPGRITGTIETDGTIGALTRTNIVSWNLAIDGDGNGSTGSLRVDNSSINLLEGNVLSATATGIYFDFSAPGFSIFQISNPTADVVWQLQGNVFSDELIREALFPNLIQAFAVHPAALELIAGSAEPEFVAALHVDQLRIRDEGGDRIRLNARFTLDPASDGIDPVSDDVVLEFSTPSGTFYPNGCAMVFPLQAGEMERVSSGHGGTWRLNDAGRARTGIERLEITGGSILFVDRRTILPSQSYANVRVELTIGNDHMSADVALVERPAGSRRWRER